MKRCECAKDLATVLAEVARLNSSVERLVIALSGTSHAERSVERWSTVKEAAAHYGKAEVTIRRWIKDRAIRSRREGLRGVRVLLSDHDRSPGVITSDHADNRAGRSRQGLTGDHSDVRDSSSEVHTGGLLDSGATIADQWRAASERDSERASDAFRRELWRHLLAVSGGAAALGPPAFRRVSLTLPRWGTAAALYAAGCDFADVVASEGVDAGCWLVLDVSPAGRPHLYGVALSPRTNEWLLGEWCALSGADRRGLRVQRVAGTGQRWNESNLILRRSVAAVVGYACKTLPESAGAGSAFVFAQRVIASGSLSDVWARAWLSTQPIPSHLREADA